MVAYIADGEGGAAEESPVSFLGCSLLQYTVSQSVGLDEWIFPSNKTMKDSEWRVSDK